MQTKPRDIISGIIPGLGKRRRKLKGSLYELETSHARTVARSNVISGLKNCWNIFLSKMTYISVVYGKSAQEYVKM